MIRFWRYLHGKLAFIGKTETTSSMDSNVLAPASGLEIRARYNNHMMELEITIFQRDRNGEVTHVAKPIEMVPIDKGTYEARAAIIFDGNQRTGQILMDDLWREGIRPKDIGTPGHLAAVQKHLEDAQAQRNVLEDMALKSQELIAHVVRQLVDNDTRV